jgi:hypothetical protein
MIFGWDGNSRFVGAAAQVFSGVPGTRVWDSTRGVSGRSQGEKLRPQDQLQPQDPGSKSEPGAPSVFLSFSVEGALKREEARLVAGPRGLVAGVEAAYLAEAAADLARPSSGTTPSCCMRPKASQLT